MKISVLSSGSKGNTTYIETDNAKILIDGYDGGWYSYCSASAGQWGYRCRE